jgi:MFS family permease
VHVLNPVVLISGLEGAKDMTLFAITASKLSRDLGYGMPISSILSSAAFTACIFFYLYIFGSFFRISVYPLINRVTVYAVFQEYIINEHLDYIIAILATALWFFLSVNNRAIRYYFSVAYGATGITLALINPDNIVFDVIALLSLPLIISITLYYFRKGQKNILNFNSKLTLRYISLIAIVISVIGIVFLVLAIFLTPNTDSSTGNDPANELFLLLSSFSTVYIFLLVFCLGVKVLYRQVLRILKLDIKEDIGQTLSDTYEQNRGRTQIKIGFLLLAMILSVVLVLIPQHPLINKDNQDIGVDTHYYVTWIGELAKTKSVSDFVYQAFVVQGQNGDRPLSLIFLFLVYQVTGSNNLSEVIEHFPIILGPGTVLAFYLLTMELTRNEKIALIAAFFGAISLHTLIGIYAGFYANWLGLIVGYISIAFLFRYLRLGRLSDIVIFSILFIGVLFIHVYTWTVLAAVSGTSLVAILLGLIWKKNKISNHFTKRSIILLLLAIFASIVIDITRMLLTGSSSGVEQDIQLAQTNLGTEQFNLRWLILNATMHDSLGGVFSNFIILVLAIFWVLKSSLREPGTVFLMIFLSAGLVPLYIGSWALQVRVFYDVPFEIPAAIALYYISTRLGSMLLTLSACTWLVAVSLITVMNYYFVWRPGVQ